MKYCFGSRFPASSNKWAHGFNWCLWSTQPCCYHALLKNKTVCHRAQICLHGWRFGYRLYHFDRRRPPHLHWSHRSMERQVMLRKSIQNFSRFDTDKLVIRLSPVIQFLNNRTKHFFKQRKFNWLGFQFLYFLSNPFN